MARFSLLTLTTALLATFTTAAPAPADSLVSTATLVPVDGVVRINDLVTLKDTVLQFEPSEGLNATTRNPAWQLDYMKSLLTYRTTDQDLIITRDEEADLKKRVSNGAICFGCMVLGIMENRNRGLTITRNVAYAICSGYACPDFSTTHLSENADEYGRERGWSDDGDEMKAWRETQWQTLH